LDTIIVGAGISGLLAAWACESLGKPFRIVDSGPLSALPRLIQGCVYLHDRCNLPPEHIRSQVLSTVVLPVPPHSSLATLPPHVLYHRKIWGSDRPYTPNSVQRLPVDQPRVTTIFSVNDALTFLTARYRDRLTIRSVRRDDVLEWVHTAYVISTIPLGILMADAPQAWTPLYIWHTALPSVDGKAPLAYTIYNVDPGTPWYRQTTMFGYLSVEFIHPIMPGLAVFKKIVSASDAEAFESAHPRILLTGRWGRWQRFPLHATYHHVRRRFESGMWI
jgi:hypothetical protein